MAELVPAEPLALELTGSVSVFLVDGALFVAVTERAMTMFGPATTESWRRRRRGIEMADLEKREMESCVECR
jgi:hypothetical protein